MEDINIGGITEVLNDKADRDLENITAKKVPVSKQEVKTMLTTPPQLTMLFENQAGYGSGDIPLSQSFKNFDKLLVVGGDDNKTARTQNTWDTWILDIMLNWGLRVQFLEYASGYWFIKPYSNGSTETLLKLDTENLVIYGVYGYNIVQET